MSTPRILGQKRSRSAVAREAYQSSPLTVVSPAPRAPSSTQLGTITRRGTSETMIMTAPRIPRAVALRMKMAGASYSHQDGLTLLTCTLGDAAQSIYEEYLRTFPEDESIDPVLTVFPVDHPATVLIPPPAQLGGILREARSILFHYHTLRSADFRNGVPALPPVLAVPPGNVRFQHAAMSGTQVLSRIQNPRDPLQYPLIASLPAGSYICTVKASWIGTHTDTHVFRA